MQLKMLVLPAPLGPMTAKNSPRWTSRLTPARAATPPKLRCKFSRARSPMRSYTPSIGSAGERTLRAGGCSLDSRFRENGGKGPRRQEASALVPCASRALELGEDSAGEQLDVPASQRVRHAPELEQAHEDAGTELLHVRLDLARDVVGIADEGQALLLRQAELELVERDVLGGV